MQRVFITTDAGESIVLPTLGPAPAVAACAAGRCTVDCGRMPLCQLCMGVG